MPPVTQNIAYSFLCPAMMDRLGKDGFILDKQSLPSQTQNTVAADPIRSWNNIGMRCDSLINKKFCENFGKLISFRFIFCKKICSATGRKPFPWAFPN